MSSSKVDQSLDEIMETGRAGASRRRGRVVRKAPVGGITKSAKPNNARAAAAAVLLAQPSKKGGNKSSKVMVRNLPIDADKNMIKKYFTETVGEVSSVELFFNQNQKSLGIANVIFKNTEGAANAVNKVNGLLIDGKPIKIEVIVDGSLAVEKAKPLIDRVSNPRASNGRAKPKPATEDKAATKDAKAEANGKGAAGKKRRGRNARPTRKTAEELDSEMADYFDQSQPADAPAAADASANGAVAAPATTDGDAMVDDIM